MVLKINDLEVWYDSLQILFGINLEVDKGEFVALVGKKGAGKTTIFKSIFNEVGKKQGHTLYWDEEITDATPTELTRRGLSYVTQKKEAFPNLSVYDNIILGAYASKEPVKESLVLVYDIFPELKAKKRKKASTLDSKEHVLLAIARALMIKPKLILIDEPSAGLIPKQQKEIFARIKRIHKKGIAILLAEQNVKSALNFAEKIYVVENGKNLVSGSSKELINNKHVRTLIE